MWIRELIKHRTFKKNNGFLKELSESMKKIETKQDEMIVQVTETATLVGSQTKHCEQTVKAVFTEIGKNTDRIFKVKGDIKN
jgi:hypothetical protein